MTEHLKNEYVKLIQQHEGIIHKVIGLYVDDPEDKKDLFQEILLQAWRSFGNFEGRSSFSTWLYRVALNTTFSFKKSEKKSKTETLEKAGDPQAPVAKKESYELLYDLIRKLDEVDRSLITLHLDGYKNKEIAEILGMTANHVNVKIYRLKNHLAESLKKEAHGYL